MPRVCTICTHAEKEAINQALINSVSLRDIAGQFHVSRSALERHKADHLPATMAKAKEASEIAQGDSLLDDLKKIQRATLNILITTYNGGAYETTLKAVREARGNLELMGKLIGQLEQQPTVNVLVTSNDWLRLRAAILRALEPYPEARQAVSEALRYALPG